MEDLFILMDQSPLIKYAVYSIVIFRLIFKPIFVILAKHVELTIDVKDNTKLAKFMDGYTYKMLSFIADYAASIKLPKRK